MQEPEIRKHRSSAFLWLLPAIALTIGLYLAYSRLSNLGPRISIEFTDAQGLEAGKTKIRFKALDIGTVTDLELSDDHNKVIAHAQITRSGANLLKKDSQFWVVKPQISASGITGLDTILSGSFIAINPGNATETADLFTGLDQPPLIPNSVPGLRVKLTSNNTRGLYSGSPVYYRGFKVGQIDEIHFDAENDRINLEAFINAPYDKLITNSTKFWNVSGISFKVDTNGANISMESLETLALGGISFSTPISLNPDNHGLDSNTIFTLYANQQDTDQPPSYSKKYYVIYFDDSVRGLSTGAPVEFNGIKVGQVIDIRLLYDEERNQAVIPILIEVEPERINRVNIAITDDNNSDDIFASLIASGLEATMKTSSLITGDKFIELSMYTDNKSTTIIATDNYSSYPIMPSRNTGISKITDDIGDIVDKVKKLPFDKLFSTAQSVLDKADNTMNSVNKALATKEVEQLGKTIDSTLKQFNNTLSSFTSTSKNANLLLTNLNNQLNTVTTQLTQALQGISPESNLYYNLNQTLQILQKTSKNVNRVMQQVNAKPNSLILGD